MKKLKILNFITLLFIIVLEILPWGAVCNFKAGPSSAASEVRKTFSYFDLTPFGYANVGPFLTAILSCIIALLLVVALFITIKKPYINAIFTLSVAALITSIAPMFYGLHFYSITGMIISLLILVSIVLCILMKARIR
ncbi:MAG: hypothetical protein RR036_01880 [Oscillospiraceae bacterium]